MPFGIMMCMHTSLQYQLVDEGDGVDVDVDVECSMWRKRGDGLKFPPVTYILL